MNTSGLFETTATELETEAESVRKKAEDLKNTSEAINPFADTVRLAGALALAFA